MAIKLRINPLSSNEVEIERIDSEKISDLVSRVIKDNQLPENVSEYLEVIVDGYVINRDYWKYTKIKDGHEILIATRAKGGNFGQVLKIAAVILVTAYVGPAAGGNFLGGVAAAAAGIATTMLLNALIPPPVAGSNLGGTGADQEDSQAYSISGQSNGVKKYGSVPKVYGTHRMFPNIGANPYVEIEPDPTTGELVQYLYAVYDFGFGPSVVSDLRIGDTPITDFTDVFYRFVDFNKPEISEGSWDDLLETELLYYKGDVEQDNVGVVIEGNLFAGDDSDDYQVVRNASNLAGGDKQEITINMTCPQGLLSYGTNGSTGTSTIELGVSFAEEGSEDWKAFNDPELVESVTLVGGVNNGGFTEKAYIYFDYMGDYTNGFRGLEYRNRSERIRNINDITNEKDRDLFKFFYNTTRFDFEYFGSSGQGVLEGVYKYWNAGDFYKTVYKTTYGIKAGQTSIYMIGNTSIGEIGATLKINGESVGTIKNKTFHDNLYGRVESSGAIYIEDTVYLVEFDEPVVKDFPLITGYEVLRTNTTSVPNYENSVQGNTYDGFRIFIQPADYRFTPKYYENAFPNLAPFTGYPFYKGRFMPEWFYNPDFNGTYIAPSLNLQALTSFDYMAYSLTQNSSGKVVLSQNSKTPVYLTIKIVPRDSTKNYRVRIQRLRSYSQYSYQITNSLALTSIVTRFDRDPITSKKRHTFLEVKIKATGQLNGTIQNLSGVVQSVLDVYDPNTQTWSKAPTNNPAWVFADLITGQINKRPLGKNRLDTNSLLEWASFSDEVPVHENPAIVFSRPRFQCNFVLDFNTTLQSVLSQVCSSGQASINIIDGKYGVLIDKKRTIPVQLFTNRNSWNFSSTRMYSENPHAINIKYVDVGSNWELIETVVYDDGYDSETATEFDELQTFAVTNSEQAWRFGRYMSAQARLRKENITIDVDFEHLICTRGDYVKITQDVMKVGGSPCRVVSVNANRITVDNKIDFDILSSYGYTFRNSLGQVKTDTLTIISSNTFDLNGDIPQSGDLFTVGKVDKVTFDCIVKSINPTGDLSATLSLVEKADAIYDAEITDTLPEYDPLITLNKSSEDSAPNAVNDLTVIDNTWQCFGGGYRYYIDISWSVPKGSAYETFEVYVDSGLGFNLIDYTKKSLYRYYVDEDNLGIEHKFKILAVSTFGSKINLSEAESANSTPLTKTSRPSNVESLFINITNEVMQLNWPPVKDCDVLEYLIRYSPKSDTTWESSIPLLRVDKNTSLAATQARTGTYLIKAIDFNGNESGLAAKAITSIPNLFNLNIIEETNDFPLLEGSRNQVELIENALYLQEKDNGNPTTTEYWPEGYYYYKEFLDLGQIYTVRLQSLIEAEGFTQDDVMANWPTLDDVDFLSNSKYSEWDVETQVRYTENLNVMSDWVDLDSVDLLSEGQADIWSDWKSFSIGDFTGRIFQFRLKLISNKASVSPRVFEGKIKADMPDRIESYENLTCPIGGRLVEFSIPFKGPSSGLSIQITQDNAQSGDRYVLTKTLSNFTIEFFDIGNNSVERTFDAMIKGFGRKAANII